MPVIGWLVGTTIEPIIRNYDYWVAFGFLAFAGGRMIYSAWYDRDGERSNDLSRGWTLALLSIAVGMDVLAVGLSLGVLGVRVWCLAIVISAVTSVLSLAGLRIGRIFGRKSSSLIEIVGGIVLIGIGLRILILHLIR